jgi:hypothetical protein
MANDARKKITTSDLLHEFGLAWEESYDKICDATQMLFQAANMGRVQLEKRRHMSPIHIGTIRQELIVLYYEISLRRIRSIWTLVCCFD